MKLRWEDKKEGSWWAYSGEIMVGMVVTQYDGDIVWQMDAVHMKWIAKGDGDAKSIEAAKRSVARSWSTWCSKAGLQAVEN